MSYEGEIFDPIIGNGSKDFVPTGDVPSNYSGHNHIYTMLVSGDTRPPVSYELVDSFTKTEGINKNLEGISIWKPIPEPGYKALGYVIDMRPFSNNNPPQPSRDLIATVPECSLDELHITLQGDYTNINTMASQDMIVPSRRRRCDASDNICSASSTIATGMEQQGRQPPRNGKFKNKKYTIQKIFDNNNE